MEETKKPWFSLKEQDYKCYYTNRPLNINLGFPESISLDRIDSSKGYIKGNVCFCQKKVNTMKNNASVEELIEFCKDVLKTIDIK